MAVVMPFLFLLILGGIIDFGMTFYNILLLQQIAEDTARYAAEETIPGRSTSPGAVSNFAQSRKPSWWTGSYTVHPPELLELDRPSGVDSSSAAVSGKSPASHPHVVRVTISYASPLFTPFYRTMFQSISGHPSMRIQATAARMVPRGLLSR